MKSITLKSVSIAFKSVLKKTLVSIVAFLAPLLPLFICVGIAIFFDTWAGRWAARKQNEEILSTKTRDGILTKMALYHPILLGMYFLDKFLLGEFISMHTQIPIAFTKITCIVILWYEGESIDEKIKKATGKSIISIIKKYIRRGKQLKNEIQEVITNESNSN